MVNLKKKEMEPVMKSFENMKAGEFFQVEGDLFMKASETEVFCFTRRIPCLFLSTGKSYPMCELTVEWRIKERVRLDD